MLAYLSKNRLQLSILVEEIENGVAGIALGLQNELVKVCFHLPVLLPDIFIRHEMQEITNCNS